MRIRKSFLTLFAFTMCFMLLCTNCIFIHAETSGDGTKESPYLIKTPEDFYNIPESGTGYYQLANDIDFFDLTKIPRGDFKGVLDGNGYAIKNLKIVGETSTTSIGLFTSLTDAEIKNLTLENISVTATGGRVGILCGGATNCNISVYIKNSKADAGSFNTVGAIAGRSDNSTLTQSTVENVTIKGGTNIGMLYGNMVEGSITKCSAIGGTVTATGANAGGLVGIAATVKITDSYSTSKVDSSSNIVGGLVGSGTVQLTRCYTNNAVKGAGSVGGLIGTTTESEINRCYTIGTIQGTGHYTGGLVGAGGKVSMTECHTTATLTSTYSYVGGLMGRSQDALTSIKNCYAAGSVNGASYNAGFVAYGTAVQIENSYSATKIVKNPTHGLAPEVTGTNTINSYFDQDKAGVTTPAANARTEANMFRKFNYTDWDFDTVWSIEEGVSYPTLQYLGNEDPSPEDPEPEEPYNNRLKVILEVKEELQLSIDENLANNSEVTWTSSDAAIVKVDANGYIKALALGNAVITIKDEEGQVIDKIQVLVVKSASEYRIAVDLLKGQTCRVTIDDNTKTTPVEWFSNDTSIATINAKGKITAVAKGFVLITAKDNKGKEIGHVYVRVR